MIVVSLIIGFIRVYPEEAHAVWNFYVENTPVFSICENRNTILCYLIPAYYMELDYHNSN